MSQYDYLIDKMSRRAYNAMKNARCFSIEELAAKPYQELRCVKNVGRKTLAEFEAILNEAGLTLRKKPVRMKPPPKVRCRVCKRESKVEVCNSCVSIARLAVKLVYEVISTLSEEEPKTK